MMVFYIIPYLIVGLILFFIIRGIISWRKKKHHLDDEDDFKLFLSKEDAISDFLLVLGFLFLGVTILTFNRDIGDIISWRTVIFITALAGLFIAYYFKAVLSLIIGLIMMAGWWLIQASFWATKGDIENVSIFGGMTLIFLFFYLFGRIHEIKPIFKRFAVVYLVFGLVFITGILFFLSTKPALSFLEEMTKGETVFNSWQLVISLSVFILLNLGVMLYHFLANKKVFFWSELFSVFVLLLLFVVLIFLPQQSFFKDSQSWYRGGGNLNSTGITWTVIFNLIIFFEVLGIIFLGYLKRKDYLINLGIFFLFALIFIKYFDWFFEFIDKSAFFIIGGILLFVVGWFMERGRRYILKDIKKQPGN